MQHTHNHMQARCACLAASVTQQTLTTCSQQSGRQKKRWACSQTLCRLVTVLDRVAEACEQTHIEAAHLLRTHNLPVTLASCLLQVNRDNMSPAVRLCVCTQVLCQLAPMLSKHLLSVTPVVAQVRRQRLQDMRGSMLGPHIACVCMLNPAQP